MRMYGKRFIRREREKSIDLKRETKDGIIWSIDISNRKVTLKIQGSNTEIAAYFPDNTHSPPPWCKLGNAIKIMHTGGIRGRIEIIGHGLVIPYPISGNIWPSDPVQENMILTGLQILAMPNLPGNKVLVTTGTARIEGTIITVGAMSLSDGDEFEMGEGGYMGEVAAILDAGSPVTAGAFPDWGYKINSVQLDQSGNITLAQGNQFKAYNNGTITMYGGGNPPAGSSLDNLPKPSVPWGSLEVGTILRYENQTIIRDFDINYDLILTLPWWRYGRQPTRLNIETDPPVMEWTDSTADISIICYDNLEQLMHFKYISLEASIVSGNGLLRDKVYDTGWDTTITAHQVVDQAGVWFPYWSLEYKRGQDISDVSPMIKFKLLINNELISYNGILLLDAGGNPMY